MAAGTIVKIGIAKVPPAIKEAPKQHTRFLAGCPIFPKWFKAIAPIIAMIPAQILCFLFNLVNLSFGKQNKK